MEWVSFFVGFVAGLVALKVAGGGACRSFSGVRVPSKPSARKPSAGAREAEPVPIERPPREAVDLGEPENKMAEGIREQDY